MFTPARFIVYTPKELDNISTSKGPESYNYYNLSNFESSKGGPGAGKHSYHRRDSSNVMVMMES